MTDIISACRYLIYLSYKSNQSLTMMKLQKILYLSQGWSYVWDSTALFSEVFEAWGTGPVNIKVYRCFRKYGRDEIPECEGISGIHIQQAMETLQAVWDTYGRMDAYYLSNLTKKHEPYIRAKEKNTVIADTDIKEYFELAYKS